MLHSDGRADTTFSAYRAGQDYRLFYKDHFPTDWAAMPRRRKRTLLDDLMMAPWWVSPVLAALAYLGLTYLAPAIIPDNPIFVALKTLAPKAAPIFALVLLAPAPFAYLNGRRKRQLVDTHSRISEIRGLSWREFEELVGEAYRRQGYRVRENLVGGPDGGVDLRLERAGRPHIVQCKHWKSSKVGVGVVRELYGVMVGEGAFSASVVISGMFTQEARQFADGKCIELIDGPGLERLLSGITARPVISPTPIPAASSPEQIPASDDCPRCGGTLVKRKAKRGPAAGNSFMGCSSYPKCRYTQDIP